jgi:hypothetical protein
MHAQWALTNLQQQIAIVCLVEYATPMLLAPVLVLPPPKMETAYVTKDTLAMDWSAILVPLETPHVLKISMKN